MAAFSAISWEELIAKRLSRLPIQLFSTETRTLHRFFQLIYWLGKLAMNEAIVKTGANESITFTVQH